MTTREDDPYRAPASDSDPVPADATAAGRVFRILLVLNVLLTFAGIAAGFLPHRFSQRLTEAFESEPLGWLAESMPPIPLFLFTLSMLAMMLSGIVGMFLFKRWGRTLSAWFTLLSLLLYPLSGPSLLPGHEQLLWDTGAMIWGGLLAMAYYSPVKTLFDGAPER